MTSPNVGYSSRQTLWGWSTPEFVQGYTVHTDYRGPDLPHGSMRSIGIVFQRGRKQTGKWAAQRNSIEHPQHGFASRDAAARWLLEKAQNV